MESLYKLFLSGYTSVNAVIVKFYRFAKAAAQINGLQVKAKGVLNTSM